MGKTIARKEKHLLNQKFDKSIKLNCKQNDKILI